MKFRIGNSVTICLLFFALALLLFVYLYTNRVQVYLYYEPKESQQLFSLLFNSGQITFEKRRYKAGAGFGVNRYDFDEFSDFEQFVGACDEERNSGGKAFLIWRVGFGYFPVNGRYIAMMPILLPMPFLLCMVTLLIWKRYSTPGTRGFPVTLQEIKTTPPK